MKEKHEAKVKAALKRFFELVDETCQLEDEPQWLKEDGKYPVSGTLESPYIDGTAELRVNKDTMRQLITERLDTEILRKGFAYIYVCRDNATVGIDIQEVGTDPKDQEALDMAYSDIEADGTLHVGYDN